MKHLKYAAMAFVGVMMAPVGAFADSGDAQLSSDGFAPKPQEITVTESGSSPGAGSVLRAGEVDDSASNIPAAAESAEDVWKLWSLKPMGAESIIGADTRTLVNPTTTYPARANVLITFSAGRCTGWMISPNTLVTAGHCVHRGRGGAAGFYPVSSYRIYPGRNGASSPYGSCTALRLSTVTGWAVNGRDDFDYAAIRLNCSVGLRTGWYGFFWTSASLTNLPTIINGYPGDKPLTQWRSTGRVTVTQPNRVFYQNDTVGGMSGSAVYYNRSTTCSPCAMAVHAYGVYGSPPFSTNNHGTRINQSVFDNLIRWRNAPNTKR